ncbi:hypothetical protein PUNSTDRAFT_45197 [Punctularia strigosozonata HHB-11173 SS5]|uniref:uncharacterized protein n=1 Tax=Punctularia strigosozonata (strain HHB-11173) TaxID=741275 RepID=UPI0004416B21|nr:uncharacterized protein PUNSTDRAFT_45197 [Punctularia strigosozonata HHB-11173 SS5]EIN07667.1 hypothetical protein PUNSTDRAFT_45197 [Punctularia strigosozonata HHB-11173 SS5]
MSFSLFMAQPTAAFGRRVLGFCARVLSVTASVTNATEDDADILESFSSIGSDEHHVDLISMDDDALATRPRTPLSAIAAPESVTAGPSRLSYVDDEKVVEMLAKMAAHRASLIPIPKEIGASESVDTEFGHLFRNADASTDDEDHVFEPNYVFDGDFNAHKASSLELPAKRTAAGEKVCKVVTIEAIGLPAPHSGGSPMSPSSTEKTIVKSECMDTLLGASASFSAACEDISAIHHTLFTPFAEVGQWTNPAAALPESCSSIAQIAISVSFSAEFGQWSTPSAVLPENTTSVDDIVAIHASLFASASTLSAEAGQWNDPAAALTESFSCISLLLVPSPGSAVKPPAPSPLDLVSALVAAKPTPYSLSRSRLVQPRVPVKPQWPHSDVLATPLALKKETRPRPSSLPVDREPKLPSPAQAKAATPLRTHLTAPRPPPLAKVILQRNASRSPATHTPRPSVQADKTRAVSASPRKLSCPPGENAKFQQTSVRSPSRRSSIVPVTPSARSGKTQLKHPLQWR